MLALFAAAFWAAKRTGVIPGLECGWLVLTLPVAYTFVLIREHRKLQQEDEEEHLPSEQALAHLPPTRFYSILGGLCILIIGGGIVLSILGSRMALPPEQGGFGLEASLIGTLFLAISTSLPELVISFASVRMGFLDMAVGNVLGSNLFNLLIIFVADVAMRGGNLLEKASSTHWTSAGMILALTLLAGGLLRSRSKKITLSIAATMLTLYIASIMLFI